MTGERTGAGDPARSLALLWRLPGATPRPGPSRALTVDAVVDSAIDLADAHGIASVTMRRLAGNLGVATMTLYTYVPGRGELLDLMVDQLYQRMARTDLDDLPWRERVSGVAADNRALYASHPWAAAVSTARPPLGPGLLAKYEHELTAVDGLGLADIEMDDALTFVLAFVQADARSRLDLPGNSGTEEAQWWAVAGPLLARATAEQRFPLADRVGTAAGQAHGSAYDADHAYAFGLARVLDGLAALVEGRSPNS